MSYISVHKIWLYVFISLMYLFAIYIGYIVIWLYAFFKSKIDNSIK